MSYIIKDSQESDQFKKKNSQSTRAHKNIFPSPKSTYENKTQNTGVILIPLITFFPVVHSITQRN